MSHRLLSRRFFPSSSSKSTIQLPFHFFSISVPVTPSSCGLSAKPLTTTRLPTHMTRTAAATARATSSSDFGTTSPPPSPTSQAPPAAAALPPSPPGEAASSPPAPAAAATAPPAATVEARAEFAGALASTSASGGAASSVAVRTDEKAGAAAFLKWVKGTSGTSLSERPAASSKSVVGTTCTQKVSGLLPGPRTSHATHLPT
mmetsp:Transcript_96504/g.245298  ORF Transcript_96504/g.245298 Transcript_96504/m.245298 type:complete len:203 (-) Transcript_96504:199-807(-)